MAIYRCNPKKNHRCRKSGCQTLCFHTCFEEYSEDGIERIFVKNGNDFDDPPVGEIEKMRNCENKNEKLVIL